MARPTNTDRINNVENTINGLAAQMQQFFEMMGNGTHGAVIAREQGRTADADTGTYPDEYRDSTGKLVAYRGNAASALDTRQEAPPAPAPTSAATEIPYKDNLSLEKRRLRSKVDVIVTKAERAITVPPNHAVAIVDLANPGYMTVSKKTGKASHLIGTTGGFYHIPHGKRDIGISLNLSVAPDTK